MMLFRSGKPGQVLRNVLFINICLKPVVFGFANFLSGGICSPVGKFGDPGLG